METFGFRKVSLADEEIINKMNHDKELIKFFVPNNNMDLVLKDNTVIGACYITNSNLPEVQIAILSDFRGKGYGTKLLQQITNELFKENVPIVITRIHKDNKASLKMAKKCGYYIDWENEEYNPDNKEDLYYTLYKRNYLANNFKRNR